MSQLVPVPDLYADAFCPCKATDLQCHQRLSLNELCISVATSPTAPAGLPLKVDAKLGDEDQHLSNRSIPTIAIVSAFIDDCGPQGRTAPSPGAAAACVFRRARGRDPLSSLTLALLRSFALLKQLARFGVASHVYGACAAVVPEAFRPPDSATAAARSFDGRGAAGAAAQSVAVTFSRRLPQKPTLPSTSTAIHTTSPSKQQQQQPGKIGSPGRSAELAWASTPDSRCLRQP